MNVVEQIILVLVKLDEKWNMVYRFWYVGKLFLSVKL